MFASQFVLFALAVTATPMMSELELVERDRPQFCPPMTVKVGDGDPHQNSFEIQVTDNLNCGAGTESCTITKLTSHTVGWTFTGGPSIATGKLWTAAGFAVTDSYTTGESYSCAAPPGQTVCVWSHIAFTAYTVVTYTPNGCDSKDTEPYVMKSPNANEVGSYFYCVTGGACRSNGQGYWVNEGRPGGP